MTRHYIVWHIPENACSTGSALPVESSVVAARSQQQTGTQASVLQGLETAPNSTGMSRTGAAAAGIGDDDSNDTDAGTGNGGLDQATYKRAQRAACTAKALALAMALALVPGSDSESRIAGQRSAGAHNGVRFVPSLVLAIPRQRVGGLPQRCKAPVGEGSGCVMCVTPLCFFGFGGVSDVTAMTSARRLLRGFAPEPCSWNVVGKRSR